MQDIGNMRRFFILCVVLFMVLAAWALYYHYEEAEKKDHIFLYGNVDIRQVDISFRVSGKLKALYFEEGDFVPQGKLVAVLDKEPYADEIKQASAAMESIKASLQNAEIVWKRRLELIGQGSISQEDLDNALANKNVLLANFQQAEAALVVAKYNLAFTEAYCPNDGTLLTRIREPGSVVNPTDPVCTISLSNPLWIRAFVNEKELGLIYPGMMAEVTMDSNPDKIYIGHIGFISPQAEFTPKTVETTQLRTDLVYRLRIYIPNPDKQLRQGMPVTVKLSLPKEDR